MTWHEDIAVQLSIAIIGALIAVVVLFWLVQPK